MNHFKSDLDFGKSSKYMNYYKFQIARILKLKLRDPVFFNQIKTYETFSNLFRS